MGAVLQGIPKCPKCVEEGRVLELWTESHLSSLAPATGLVGGGQVARLPEPLAAPGGAHPRHSVRPAVKAA